MEESEEEVKAFADGDAASAAPAAKTVRLQVPKPSHRWSHLKKSESMTTAPLQAATKQSPAAPGELYAQALAREKKKRKGRKNMTRRRRRRKKKKGQSMYNAAMTLRFMAKWIAMKRQSKRKESERDAFIQKKFNSSKTSSVASTTLRHLQEAWVGKQRPGEPERHGIYQYLPMSPTSTVLYW